MALSHTSFAFLIKMISSVYRHSFCRIQWHFRRAEADARHAVGAILAPNGFAVFNSMLLSGHIFAHLPHPMHLSFAVNASALTKNL